MSTYISRQAAIDVIAEHMMYEARKEYATASTNIEDWKDVARSLLSGIPCADVEEVIRCKDCKYNSGSELNILCDNFYGSWQPDDFCSFGETRE